MLPEKGGTPQDTWGQEMVKRAKKDPRELLEFALINRKATIGEYICGTELIKIKKLLIAIRKELKSKS